MNYLNLIFLILKLTSYSKNINFEKYKIGTFLRNSSFRDSEVLSIWADFYNQVLRFPLHRTEHIWRLPTDQKVDIREEHLEVGGGLSPSKVIFVCRLVELAEEKVHVHGVDERLG
jgi:hypothetical protein